MKPKLLVICGPTAIGKSDLAVELATKNNGEVVSADSRQIYRGLNIGAGKITQEEMRGVPHYLLDIADPDQVVSVVEYKQFADRAIADIVAHGKLPILCGGTGLYISAVVDNRSFPEVVANETLRAELAKLSTEELAQKLGELDPDRLETIDQHNPVRLIRAIEIATALGKVPSEPVNEPRYDVTLIGLELPPEELRARIEARLDSRLANGMIEEVRNLHENGVSWERLESLGLEYRYVAQYLQDKLTYTEMREQLGFKIWQYAKRQIMWFKRDKRIRWFRPDEKQKILHIVEDLFL